MDSIEKIGHSLIQHGCFNNRIYLLKFDKRDQADLTKRLNELAQKNAYGKIITKVPESANPIFLKDGYKQEAYIPEFYKDGEGVFFMAKYFNNERAQVPNKFLTELSGLLASPRVNEATLPVHFSLKITEPSNAGKMAQIYREVFKTYPFPILNASYLEKTMLEGKVIYFGIWDNGKLAGLSSAELDSSNRNAEMTDFAVLPEYRGQKLAYFLLQRMEEEMRIRQFKTLYTIARLNSQGMSKTFINHGYHYSGLLKNNTNISGQIESMTVFYKNI